MHSVQHPALCSLHQSNHPGAHPDTHLRCRLSRAVLPSEVKALLPSMLQELESGDEHEQGLREVLHAFLEKEVSPCHP